MKWLAAAPLTWSASARLAILSGTRDTWARRLLIRCEGSTLPGG